MTGHVRVSMHAQRTSSNRDNPPRTHITATCVTGCKFGTSTQNSRLLATALFSDISLRRICGLLVGYGEKRDVMLCERHRAIPDTLEAERMHYALLGTLSTSLLMLWSPTFLSASDSFSFPCYHLQFSLWHFYWVPPHFCTILFKSALAGTGSPTNQSALAGRGVRSLDMASWLALQLSPSFVICCSWVCTHKFKCSLHEHGNGNAYSRFRILGFSLVPSFIFSFWFLFSWVPFHPWFFPYILLAVLSPGSGSGTTRMYYRLGHAHGGPSTHPLDGCFCSPSFNYVLPSLAPSFLIFCYLYSSIAAQILSYSLR